MREREAAKVTATQKNGTIVITLTHSLDPKMYDLPLTLKTYVPDHWKNATITGGPTRRQLDIRHDDKGNYVLYQAKPNTANTILQP